MKTMKKLFALLLAVLMVMGMATTAMAAPATSGTITINHAHKGHTYVAYQIFDGTLDGNILTDIEWGSGIDHRTDSGDNANNDNDDTTSDLIEDIRKVKRGEESPLGAAQTAADVAALISAWSKDDASLKALAEVFGNHLIPYDENNSSPVVTFSYDVGSKKYVSGQITDPGYYLIKDLTPPTDATATDYLLQIVGTIEITPKAVNPTFAKSVNTHIDGTYQEAISVEVGETFYVKLESQMPSMLSDYKQYYLSFEEEIPTHLTNAKIADVFLQHRTSTTSLVMDDERNSDGSVKIGTNTYFTISTTADTNGVVTGLRLDFKNLKKIPNISENDTVVVKYSVDVTKTIPVVGGTGNVRTAKLYFTSDMNQAAPTAEIGGVAAADATLKSHGKSGDNANGILYATMEDSAAVYTYGIDIDKIDGNSKDTLGGAVFALYRTRIVTEGNTEKQKKYYAIFEQVADANKPTHYRITGWEHFSDSGSLNSRNKVTSYSADGEHKGEIIIIGIGGNVAYHLEEVAPPSQYNSMDAPVIIEAIPTINGKTLEGLAGKADGSDVTGDKTTGLVNITVENNKGNTLPTTGGIGTTIFYIVGGVLVLGAGAAFVMKRRNEA